MKNATSSISTQFPSKVAIAARMSESAIAVADEPTEPENPENNAATACSRTVPIVYPAFLACRSWIA